MTFRSAKIVSNYYSISGVHKAMERVYLPIPYVNFFNSFFKDQYFNFDKH